MFALGGDLGLGAAGSLGEVEEHGPYAKFNADVGRVTANAYTGGMARFADPGESADDTFTRILPSPRHVPIVVAGARNAAISMVVRIFGEWSGTATKVTK